LKHILIIVVLAFIFPLSVSSGEVLVPVITLLLEDDTPPLVCDGGNEHLDETTGECACDDGYEDDGSGTCEVIPVCNPDCPND
jgi:hypothetical protein